MKLIKAAANFSIPEIYFVGRWSQTKHGMYTSNVGAQLFTQASGSSQVEFIFSTKGNPKTTWLAYQVDDADFVRQFLPADGKLKVVLPDENTHNIRVVYSSYQPDSNVWKRHEGLYFDEAVAVGGQLTPIKPANTAITFIGDSVTAGTMIHGMNVPDDSCAEASYAAQVADYFSMEDVRIAYYGGAITHPAKGDVPSMAQVLDKVSAKNEWQVVASSDVVINLGANDQKANDLAFRVDFEFIMQKIKLMYPKARLWVIVPLNQQHAAIIADEAKEYPNTQVIETKQLDLTYTDGKLHPDIASSQKLAQCVIEHLAPVINAPQI